MKQSAADNLLESNASYEALDSDSQSNKNAYAKKLITLDIVLFAFSVWSLLGYALFSRTTSLQSIEDPLTRYLYPHISDEKVQNTHDGLSGFAEFLAFSDVALTIGTLLNMRNCREMISQSTRNELREYRNGDRNSVLFGVNLLLTLMNFGIGSFAPWTGFETMDYSRFVIGLCGFTMYIGQMVIYIMCNAPFIFTAPKQISEFSNLNQDTKKLIWNNIFHTEEGRWGFIPRSIFNIVNRCWIFYGLSQRTVHNVFKTENPVVEVIYAILAIVAAGWQTLNSQVVKDYRVKFNSPPSTTGIVNSSNSILSPAYNCIMSIPYLLIPGTYLLRVLTIPSLYTGEIKDPATDYDIGKTIIALIGLVSGLYSAVQYSRYMYGRFQDGMMAFFKSSNVNIGKDSFRAIPHSDEAGFSSATAKA